jgi:hypothetical protein
MPRGQHVRGHGNAGAFARAQDGASRGHRRALAAAAGAAAAAAAAAIVLSRRVDEQPAELLVVHGRGGLRRVSGSSPQSCCQGRPAGCTLRGAWPSAPSFRPTPMRTCAVQQAEAAPHPTSSLAPCVCPTLLAMYPVERALPRSRARPVTELSIQRAPCLTLVIFHRCRDAETAPVAAQCNLCCRCMGSILLKHHHLHQSDPFQRRG